MNYVVRYFVSLALFYAAGAFIVLEPNVLLWSESSRMFLVLMPISGVFFSLAMFPVKESK